jgi:hypothetical protein
MYLRASLINDVMMVNAPLLPFFLANQTKNAKKLLKMHLACASLDRSQNLVRSSLEKGINSSHKKEVKLLVARPRGIK